MLDPKWIRENPGEVRELLKKRRHDFDLDGLLELDAKRRDILTRTEELKSVRNEGSRKVGDIKKQGGDASALMEEMRAAGERIKEMDAELAEIDRKFPNPPDDDAEQTPRERAGWSRRK